MRKNLEQKIIKKEAKVAVVGMGYVGLAVAQAIVSAGYKVLGYDISEKRVSELENLKNQGIIVTSTIKDIKDADVFLVCLPTPVKEYVNPDLSSIEHSINELSKNVIKEGQLLILESTVQPGTTRDFVLPLILKNNKSLEIGKNFFLGYSPERVDPGNKNYSNISSIPKIVSGITSDCLDLTELFYSQFIEKLHKASSVEIAEFAKLFENTFRAVNIAFVYEMARIANRLGMNIMEILEAAYTKPFGIMPFWPSVGVGGHCIPVDLLYLHSWARSNDCYSQFIELAHRVNQGMPYYVLQRITKILNESSKSLKGAKILLIGATYKPNVSDTRSSAALKLAELFVNEGVDLSVHDPFLSILDIECNFVEKLSSELLIDMDLVVIAVAHDCLDLDFICKHSDKIFQCSGKPLFSNKISSKIYSL